MTCVRHYPYVANGCMDRGCVLITIVRFANVFFRVLCFCNFYGGVKFDKLQVAIHIEASTLLFPLPYFICGVTEILKYMSLLTNNRVVVDVQCAIFGEGEIRCICF